MATPLSPQELERRRIQSMQDKSARSMVQRPSQPTMKNTPLPMTPSNPATSQTLPQVPKTVSEQYFSGNRDQKNVGTFKNTSENGYTRGNAPLSQTAQDAQKRNEQMVASQQKTVGNIPAPKLEFGENVNTPQIGEPGQKLEFGTNVATPQVDATAPISPTTATTGAQGTTQPQTTTTAPTGQPTGETTGQSGIPSTGVAGYDQAISEFKGVADTAVAMAKEERDQIQQNLKNKYLQSIGITTIDDIARAEGRDLTQMSFQDLQNYAAQKGIQLDETEREKLRAGGMAALENLEYGKNTELALNDLTRRQVEREFGRALEEREQFNVAQDVRMRALMGSFGVDNIASNTAVLKSLDDGLKAKSQLIDQFADKLTPLSFQAQGIIRNYTNNVNQVMSQMAQLEEDKYAEIVQTLQDLADQGVTSEKDLRKAVLGEMRDYAKMYNEINDKALNYLQEQNKQLFEETKFMMEEQRKQDDFMTSNTGIMYKDGAPLVDQFGNTVPTMDNLKFTNEIDQQLTQSTGFIYKNGVPLLDSQNNPIQSFDREKFITQENRLTNQFNMGYGLDVSKLQLDQAKFEQDVAQFGLEYARDQQKLAIEMADKGIVPVQQNMVDPNSGINPEKSQYGMSITADGAVTFNLPADGKAPNGRGQCGEFVNDALGLIGGKKFTNLISEKEKLINSQVPVAGGAFIQRTGNQYGHVGIVTKVYPDGSFDFVDSNRKGNETIATGRMPANYAEKGVVGFTTGVQSNVGYQKQGTGAESQSILDKIPKNAVSAVTQISGRFDNEPQVKNFQMVQSAKDLVNSLPDDTKNPTDDQALIYAFAKVMDPGSVVREGEYNTVQRYSQSWAQQYGSSVSNAVLGQGFLTPEARKNIKKTIDTKYNVEKSSYDSLRNSYINNINKVAGVSVANDLLPEYTVAIPEAPVPTGTDVRMYKDGKAYDIPSDKVSTALFKGYTY